MTDAIVGDVTIFPDRLYHIFAGHRCIQDFGVGGNIQMQVSIGTVNLQGYDVVACTDPNSSVGGVVAGLAPRRGAARGHRPGWQRAVVPPAPPVFGRQPHHLHPSPTS